MRLESALNAGREGITVHGQAISVIGDNISNSNTVGFKSSRTEFSDILSEGADGIQSDNIEYGGTGVSLMQVRTLLKQGGVIEPTGRDLDVAVDGNGFFVVGDPASPRFTRAGNFTLDPEGNLVSSSGAQVLGYKPGATTLSPLNLFEYNKNGTATETATLLGNIDANSAITTQPAAPTSFSEIAKGASFVAPLTAYDSLGSQRPLSVAFYKTGPGTFEVAVYADGKDTGGTEGQPVKVGGTANGASLQFDENGSVTTNGTVAINAPWNNGAAAGSISLDLTQFTQYSGPSALQGSSQDGQAVGNEEGYEIDGDGAVYALLSSGTRSLVGNIALANFRNIDGLTRGGSSEFIATDATGEITYGKPGSGALGAIQGSSLERSTVDISEEFVNLILFQRGYQANSQSMTAVNDLLKQTIQMMG